MVCMDGRCPFPPLQSNKAKEVWLTVDIEDHVTERSEWAEVSCVIILLCGGTPTEFHPTQNCVGFQVVSVLDPNQPQCRSLSVSYVILQVIYTRDERSAMRLDSKLNSSIVLTNSPLVLINIVPCFG